MNVLSNAAENIEADNLIVCNNNEDNFFEELLSARDLAQNINMDLPTLNNGRFRLLSCPECTEINAFDERHFGKNVMGVCDFCDAEFVL